jgi:hypothetical protein
MGKTANNRARRGGAERPGLFLFRPSRYHPAMSAKLTPARKLTPQDGDAEFLAAVDQGLAEIKAGKGVSYAKVRRWLLSWGTDNELPPPKTS